jgi:copper chaperone CopZ
MTCAACTTSVEGVLQGLPGVTRVGVSLTSGEAEVVHDPALCGAEELAAAVEDAGFDAKVRRPMGQLSSAQLSDVTLQLQE